MSRLDEVLAKTRAEGRPALVGYLPAGFPDKQTAIEAMVAMVDAGVDIVEIGLPYSDPVMDGPTIQKAGYSQPPSLLENSQPFLPCTSTISGQTVFILAIMAVIMSLTNSPPLSECQTLNGSSRKFSQAQFTTVALSLSAVALA